MRPRLILTMIWLASMVTGIVVLLSYEHSYDDDGLRMIFREDLIASLKPLTGMYAGYLAGILAFWFIRPFKPPRTDQVERQRFWVALACTMIFNLLLLFYVCYVHLFGTSMGTVQDNVMTSVKIAGFLSFLVAPVNAYYFGGKAPAA